MSSAEQAPPPVAQPVGAHATDEEKARVRLVLQEHAPCETGYPGISTCKICVGGQECAGALEAMMRREYPGVDWAPAIREVLGLW